MFKRRVTRYTPDQVPLVLALRRLVRMPVEGLDFEVAGLVDDDPSLAAAVDEFWHEKG